MFDFLPVGGALALIGALFLIVVSWRLIPVRKNTATEASLLRPYTTEVVITEDSPLSGLTVKALELDAKHEIRVLSTHTGEATASATPETILSPGQTINIVGTLSALVQYTTRYTLSLSGLRAKERFVTNEDDYVTKEVLIPPYAKIIGTNWDTIPLERRYGVNFIALFRRDTDLTEPLRQSTLWPNDILVLHGRSSSVTETIQALQLLPIATTESNLGRQTHALITLALLVMAVSIAAFGIIPLEVIFLTTAILLILLNIISLREAYESIDLTVLILLAGMITLGKALLASGAAASIAAFVVSLDSFVGPIVMLTVVLMATMLLSDFMNTTASAVIMAPVAIMAAQSMSLSIDPFLIAVAIGSSCAFLTPVGHESNAMIMRQGGYTFTDYFRVGLPLEIIIITTSIPLIIHFWPL
jgi:di/tricarboxylate transporter